ncbi:PIN domain-like protein [Auricularia subglabra TFB-10046 SS5]|nr:PIN domain-like protein [Auricularia subglabra TFB-10046 SS5]
MGVTGLFEFLNAKRSHSHIETLAGTRLGIDGYVVLHRGALTCARELASGVPTTAYLHEVKRLLLMLRHYDIEPYFVFDGQALPAKANVTRRRMAVREEAILRAATLEKKGDKRASAVAYKASVVVTTQMVTQTIKILRAAGIPYLVAPYEADAQLAFLDRVGLIDAVYSEDSDLVVFGVQKLVCKLQDDGACAIVRHADLSVSHSHLRLMALLAGCDYTRGLPGVGLATAHKVANQFPVISTYIKRRFTNTPELELFQREMRLANAAFLFQTVFDPKTRALISLNDLTDDVPWDDEVQAHVGRCVSDGYNRARAAAREGR